MIEVAGQIDNRWQMDGYDGVLRVISQPSSWTAGAAPVVESAVTVLGYAPDGRLSALGSVATPSEGYNLVARGTARSCRVAASSTW